MSSAQAAATAAFKSKAAAEMNAKPKPKLRLPREAMVPRLTAQNIKTTGSAVSPLPAKLSHHSSTTSETHEGHAASENGDYFSLRKGTTPSTPKVGRSKVSTNTRPQDMLDSVRHSIQSKSKTNTSKESFAKNQIAINEFRHSVDLKRVTTPTPGDSTSHSAHPVLNAGDRFHSSASLVLNSSNNTSDHEYGSHCNLSRSSFGSAVSENEVLDSSAPNLTITMHGDSDEKLRAPNARAVTPIHIPPSPHARAREMAVINDAMPLLSLLQQTSSDALDSSIPIIKPGRKPPPSQGPDLSVRSPIARGSFDSDRKNLSDTDDSTGASFPLFPALSTKHHNRRNIFKKKKKVDSKGVVYDPSSCDDTESDLIPNSNSNSVNTQHVKLKTTMRKVSKRKERKTTFNEDKPWKHQKDLEVISEPQRKRYEGLWVSNKGLYMDRVVTKLVGVDYSEVGTPKAESESRLSEKDIIERAAKLSSKALTETDYSDVAALHGLKEASPSDLMHGAVVKRLWSRSKLSPETLAAIWNLVDVRQDGTLNKSEFIVGMWYVDQCLYGRKLPKVVGQLVWASLGSLGVNVTIKKKRR